MSIVAEHLKESLSQRTEVREAIDAWISLKETQWNYRGQRPTLARIIKVLQFIGLQCDIEEVVYDYPNRFTRNSPRRYITLEIERDNIPNGLRGLPQFGSETGGIYHVVCLWDARPDLVTTTSQVREKAKGGMNAVIVLYLGGLTNAERNEIRRKCWKEDLSVAVLDELLMEFLSGQPKTGRFVSFLNCALAFSALNPFISEEAWGAPVPPEMFYGRDRIIADIENMGNQGVCLLFGGRQLGKTSLLRHVERRIHQPEQRRFAWYIDLKGEDTVEGAGKDPLEIWRILCKRFANDGLIEGGSDDSPEVIRDSLRRRIREEPRLRVLAMFDEADVFLESDTQNKATVVESMRTMMAETNRFKVVFAGLHSVQRFAYASQPNNPFLNLGYDERKPRRGGLGPLGYSDAQRLVQEPLRNMGFHFETPLLVDRILTYTECHPSEVQFFCHRLVQLIRERNSTSDVPIVIQPSDVEEVAESHDILGGIQRRFEQTLRLAEWYSAISLSMISDYDSPRQGSKDVDGVRSLLRERREDGWLPERLDEKGLSDHELNSLLTELVGLGILAEDDSGYHIRSPRIARVFGSPDDVLEELLKLGERDTLSLDSPD